MTDDPYPIDLESVCKAFPPGIDAPPLLLDFAHWLNGRPWGSVGCFSLTGDFTDNAPIVDGGPLRDQFALFARLPEGSVVGSWYGARAGGLDAPIVVLGSEGQHDIIAGTLEGLLAKIALQRFEDEGEWTDFTPHEFAEDETGELADWLIERLPVKDLRRLTDLPANLPDIAQEMERWGRDREAFWKTHPVMAELAKQLSAHLPEGKTPWDRTIFEVEIAGRQYQARVLDRGRQPIREAAAIEPILRGLRDDMWRTHPDLGLWYSMSFSMGADGSILPRFDYETRPMIGDVPAELTEARADLVRAPRPARWVPAWLAAT